MQCHSQGGRDVATLSEFLHNDGGDFALTIGWRLVGEPEDVETDGGIDWTAVEISPPAGEQEDVQTDGGNDLMAVEKTPPDIKIEGQSASPQS